MEHDDMLQALGRIEGKQDMMLDLMKEDRKRITKIEHKVWMGHGIVGVIAFIAARLGLSMHT